MEHWQEQLRRGALELAVLLAVAPEPRYGLEIIRHLEYTDLVLTEGVVYPILARLAREGLLKAEWIANEAPHPRKYYELTAEGRDRLVQMSRQFHEFTGRIERLIEAALGAER
jgi:PadR family transcriptional regulator PadR